MESQPTSAIVDVKYSGQVLKLQLQASSDAEQEARQFIQLHNLPEKFLHPLIKRFTDTIQKLAPVQLQQVQLDDADPYGNYLTQEDNMVGSQIQTFIEEDYQNDNQQQYNNYNVSKPNVEKANSIINETLNEPTYQKQNTYDKLFNQAKNSKIMQNTNSSKITITSEQQQQTFQRLYDQSKNQLQKDIKMHPSVTTPQNAQLLYFKQQKATDRLYNQRQNNLQSNYQQKQTPEEKLIREITCPEISKKEEICETTRELTQNYCFLDKLAQNSVQYAKQQQQLLLKTTRSELVLKNLTKNMSSQDKLYWAEQFKQRIFQKEEDSTQTKQLTMKRNEKGREVYKYENVEFDFKPKINSNSKQMVKSALNQTQNHGQSLQMRKRFDPQIAQKCQVKEADFMQKFTPKLISKPARRYDQDIVSALFE